MAGLISKVGAIKKKVKKHGKKAGQKSLIKPSQKKAVKNGRHQEVDGPKKAVRVAKAVKAIPVTLDGPVESDELDEFLQEPEFDYAESDTDKPDYFDEPDFLEEDKEY